MRVFVFLMFGFVMIGGLNAAAQEPSDNEAAASLPLSDDFEGELELNWQVVRPNPSHVSLTKHDGTLCITTQRGNVASGEAKNIYLLDLPEVASDYVVTTCLRGFRPMQMWQQAGLIFYNEDSDHLRYVCEYGNVRRPILNVVRQQSVGQREIDNLPVPFAQVKFWLRVTKVDDVYYCASSDDGEHFATHGVFVWDAAPQHVGLVAKNSYPEDVKDIDAPFDYFEVRDLTPEERADPNLVDRTALQGAWKVVALHHNGQELAGSQAMRFEFGAEKVAIVEGDKKKALKYELDAKAKPPRLSTLLTNRHNPRYFHYAYGLDDQKLTLALTPEADADAPDSLESTEGDGCFVMQLEKTDRPEDDASSE